MDRLEEITKQLNDLKARADQVLQEGEADASKHEEVKALLEGKDGEPGLQDRIATLENERAEAIREEEFKAMKGKITTLGDTIEELKKAPEGIFTTQLDDEGKSLDEKDPYRDESHSVFNDIRLANKGVASARERLVHGFEGKGLNEEGKAMTEGTAGQGGYLVRPQVERQLVEARELDNVLRGLCSKLNVNTSSISLDQLGLSTTAGWVAELAQKPESTAVTLATVTASIFQAAGLATISNQLLADSNPAVDGLVTSDLAKRLVALEETAFISGTGTGQPLGILNTPGLGSTPLTDTTAAGLIDAILDAISDVETNHGAPSAILLHPRTWTFILKAKDTAGAWLLGPPTVGAHADVRDSRTVANGPAKFLWGYPVVTSNRIPTNLGAGTNESRVIVGDFSEALILDRQGITVDESAHVYFTTNQTVFRAEERVGFTAARTPGAFNVVGGAGLANH
jgi:HK97 family phage major capsid protein